MDSTTRSTVAVALPLGGGWLLARSARGGRGLGFGLAGTLYYSFIPSAQE